MAGSDALDEVQDRRDRIVASLRRELAAADDGADPTVVRRRRSDSFQKARAALADLRKDCRIAMIGRESKLIPQTSERHSEAETLAEHGIDFDEHGVIHVEPRWPAMRARLDREYSYRDVKRCIRVIANELVHAKDENGLLVLYYQLEGYLGLYCRWAQADVDDARAIVSEAETLLRGEPPPEVRLADLRLQIERANQALQDGSAEIRAIEAETP